ncbi:MAG: CHRD domain-containing protein [Gammaproteobacteria bacterium]|nr:CHRD domain-containing protein [Gammaproteobacteria bacterium]
MWLSLIPGLFTASILVASIVISPYSYGREEILNQWINTYPNAEEYFHDCRLCHLSSSGDQPWNSYGWLIRQLESELGNYTDAFAQAESFDSDNDPSKAWNRTEIDFGTFPGWTTGNNNPTYYENNGMVTVFGESAPILNNIDPPPPLTNPFPNSIPKGLTLELDTISTGFVSPIRITATPGIPNSLFVADQVGIVWEIDLVSKAKSVFHDMSTELVDLAGFYDERGLLGMAFHPQYIENGLFYTYQSENDGGVADFGELPADHQSVVSEWLVLNPASVNRTVVPGSKRVLLRINQPQKNHNGGMLGFGPDNYLYIGLGDGGGKDDVDGQVFEGIPMTGHGAQGNGQNNVNPLGTILRIDPNGNNSANGQYGIPSDNPFFTMTTNEAKEIYAFGFRNPFTFSFDSVTGDLWVGDVGQNDIEEVNLVESGSNYGWNAKEGSHYFYPNGQNDGYVSATPSPNSTVDMIDPILEYDHDEGLSVVSGYVYRGNEISNLEGHYVFGDWSNGFGSPNGRIFYSEDFLSFKEFRIGAAGNLNLFLTGIGQDNSGELYIAGKTNLGPSGSTGIIQKLVSAEEEEICIPVSAKGQVVLICL